MLRASSRRWARPARDRRRAALVAALLAACGPVEGPRRGQGILVVAVDALRADHVGAYGYDRETTPMLDDLAAEGVLFERCWSTAPWLLPAHVSLLTGCDPRMAQRRLPPEVPRTTLTTWHVPDELRRLPEELLSRGWTTAAFLDHPYLGEAYGFQPGFEVFQAYDASEHEVPLDVGSSGTVQRFVSWLSGRREDDWFAYLHLHDLERVWSFPDPQWNTFFEPRPELDDTPPVAEAMHAFHAIPRRRWRGGVKTLGEYEAYYDGAVRRLDGQLGRLFQKLRQMDRWESTTVVVVGTYGFGFGEAGLVLDHGTLSDCDLRVPLILKPGRDHDLPAGTRLESVASTLDLAPTLLGMLGLPWDDMHGHSQVEAIRGDLEAARLHALATCGLREGFVLVDRRYCLEVTWPGRSDHPSLVTSWFGSAPDRDEPWIALHDREADPRVGHRATPDADPRVVEHLREAMDVWNASIEKQRLELASLTLFADEEDVDRVLRGSEDEDDELGKPAAE